MHHKWIFMLKDLIFMYIWEERKWRKKLVCNDVSHESLRQAVDKLWRGRGYGVGAG